MLSHVFPMGSLFSMPTHQLKSASQSGFYPPCFPSLSHPYLSGTAVTCVHRNRACCHLHVWLFWCEVSSLLSIKTKKTILLNPESCQEHIYILTCEVASAAQSILLQWLCDPSVVFSCFCWTPHISATRRVGQGVEDGKRLEMRRMGLKFNFQMQRPQARNWHVKLHLPPNRFCCSGYVIHLLCSAVFAGHLTSQPLCTMYLLVWHEPHRTGELLSKLEAKLERPRPKPAVGRDSFLKASAQAFDIS